MRRPVKSPGVSFVRLLIGSNLAFWVSLSIGARSSVTQGRKLVKQAGPFHHRLNIL